MSTSPSDSTSSEPPETAPEDSANGAATEPLPLSPQDAAATPHEAPAATPKDEGPSPAQDSRPTAGGPRRSLGARIGEWFWRSEAIVASKAVDDADRSRTASIAGLAEQRGEAAETLWSSGHLAEALRLAVDAFSVASTLETPAGELEAVVKARAAAAASTELPDRDAEVGDEHTERFVELQAGRRALVRSARARVASAGDLRWERVRRVGASLGAVAALVPIVWLSVRTPPRVDVSSSGQFPGAQYAPGNAFDDDESTEWVLADGESGWVEGRLIPARSIDSVQILNGRNGRFGDRATKRYRVKLMRSGQLVAEHAGMFGRIGANSEWVRLPLAGQDIDVIRFEALDSYGRGAALAEIAWSE